MKIKILSLILISSIISGCAVRYVRTEFPGDIYPARMAKDAPLVLAIPGMNVPGLIIKQESHFGDMVRMLADRGIPSKVIVYDSDEHPLTPVASLGFDKTSIAVTRVGPEIVNEVQVENERRAALGFPPVKEVVVFSFSQGAIIAARLVMEIKIFQKMYREFREKYGREWEALQEDPEFILLMNVMDDFIGVSRVKVQREREFERDPDLRNLYERAKKKLDVQNEEFAGYLLNPHGKYAGVEQFDPPETKKYPKKYEKLRAWAEKCFKDKAELENLKRFFTSYASYRDLLDVNIRFISAAGSFFGSPLANISCRAMDLFPPLKLCARQELRQIRETRLGSRHQLEWVKGLVRFKEMNVYPLTPEDTLFIVGANGEKGDGFIDQSSAHLAHHIFARTEASEGNGPVKDVVLIINRLPDIPVAPLPVTHLPKEAMLFGDTYGAAYMVEGNPSFDCLMAFIGKDTKRIEYLLSERNIRLRQFMIEISFGEKFKKGKVKFTKKGSSRNIIVDKEFYNNDTDTCVWTGAFVGGDQWMKRCGKEDTGGFVRFEYSDGPAGARAVEVPVHPGCNTFVEVE